MTHHWSQIDYTYNQLKSVAHNHILSDLICDGASQSLKLNLMITFNPVVQLELMTSRFDHYNIKIILVKWD